MELKTAVSLLEGGVGPATHPQKWADLGSGSGLFTHALATLLPAGSTILSVDKLKSNFAFNVDGQIAITTHTSDFTTYNLGKSYDGIVMANALHYVNAWDDFIERLKSALSTSGKLLIVEYDRTKPNPWVPYPIPFDQLKTKGIKAGFKACQKLKEVPSTYDQVMIYSAELTL